jgi:hypothetical protein
MDTTTRTTTDHVYDAQGYNQERINAGQRQINFALTLADKAIVDVLAMVKEAFQQPPGEQKAYVDRICRAIDAATKAIGHVASIRPPGCDETWKPEPEPITKG